MNPTIQLKRGLDLPISGTPNTIIEEVAVSRIAVIGEYHGLRPSMHVEIGDLVKRGDTLFVDKKNPSVHFTAPGAGRVVAMNRGAKRVLQSVVIELNGGTPEACKRFPVPDDTRSVPVDHITQLLQESGLWTAIRARPFGKIPHPDSSPNALFINCMDSNPLGCDMDLVMRYQNSLQFFQSGLEVLARLTQGPVFVCQASHHNFALQTPRATTVSFSGPHPSGLVGTHIHHLFPVSRERSVWYINAQDVIAIGKFFSTGVVHPERIIALGGPMVTAPCHILTRCGASINDLTKGRLSNKDEAFIVSGSLLSGHHAHQEYSFLGRYHQQISVIENDEKRYLFGYLSPGFNKFSALGIYVSSFYKRKSIRFTNNVSGSERAMVPVGSYEKVLPMDILPTQLLRAVLVGDLETAEQLGVLELEEEDLGLCTFVCPGKYEYAGVLRQVLNHIEAEG